MENKIRYYVEELFAGAKRSEQMIDTREEIIANLQLKYKDLISRGIGENEAYEQAIESIGDINEILRNLGTENASVKTKKPKRSDPDKVLCSSINILIWVVVIALYFVVSFYSQAWSVTWIIFIFTPAVNCLIGAYFAKRREKTVLPYIEIAICSLMLTLYFIFSFATGQWAVTWIIFLIGIAVWQIARIIGTLGGKRT